jgi:hypothetical protein
LDRKWAAQRPCRAGIDGRFKPNVMLRSASRNALRLVVPSGYRFKAPAFWGLVRHGGLTRDNARLDRIGSRRMGPWARHHPDAVPNGGRSGSRGTTRAEATRSLFGRNDHAFGRELSSSVPERSQRRSFKTGPYLSGNLTGGERQRMSRDWGSPGSIIRDEHG